MGRRLLLVVLVGLLVGCAGKTKPEVHTAIAASGQALVGVGNAFVSAAGVFKAGCEARTISVQTCNDFRNFGVEFKLAYPLAVQAWHTAAAANDPIAAQNATTQILMLSNDLTALAATGLATYGGR